MALFLRWLNNEISFLSKSKILLLTCGISMNPQRGQIKLALMSFVLFAFLACGITGLFCPMASSATETPQSQPTSHHSSSKNSECLDQLKTSEEESKQLSLTLLQAVGLENLGSWTDYFTSRISKSFFKEGTTIPNSYPPPFLLFSVLLN